MDGAGALGLRRQAAVNRQAEAQAARPGGAATGTDIGGSGNIQNVKANFEGRFHFLSTA